MKYLMALCVLLAVVSAWGSGWYYGKRHSLEGFTLCLPDPHPQSDSPAKTYTFGALREGTTIRDNTTGRRWIYTPYGWLEDVTTDPYAPVVAVPITDLEITVVPDNAILLDVPEADPNDCDATHIGIRDDGCRLDVPVMATTDFIPPANTLGVGTCDGSVALRGSKRAKPTSEVNDAVSR